jgi:dethiobiotin synthetase
MLNFAQSMAKFDILNKNQQYVITGIGTDVGKTVVSAIIAEALQSTYWKPVQAGDLTTSDSIKIGAYTDHVTILPEAYRLKNAMSPHAAAEKEGIEISIKNLALPEVQGNLIVEGAGGLMVPINTNGLLFIDLFAHWKLPVIVVSRHYLGSINHTLMTLEILKQRKISIAGIVFVGDENLATETAILANSDVKMLARIPMVAEITKKFISEQAMLLTEILESL